MKHSEFVIGQHFSCGGSQWRCTDIGSRVIVAIPIDYAELTTSSGDKVKTETRAITDKDLAGPPYFLAEAVFDEYDIVACHKI